MTRANPMLPPARELVVADDRPIGILPQQPPCGSLTVCNTDVPEADGYPPPGTAGDRGHE